MRYITLDQLPANKEAKVSKICAGRNLAERLFSRGIMRGVRITRKNKGCPLHVQVGESRYVLGWGMAQKILVEYEDN